MKTAVIIPARLKSTRLPKKLLLKDTGKSVITYTIENALSADLHKVLVASDSKEILKEALKAGADCFLSKKDHINGSSRVAEAALSLSSDFDVIVNLQGDEPSIKKEDIQRLANYIRDSYWGWVTFASPLNEDEKYMRSVVKVAVSKRDEALYFSRAPLGGALKHVGVYAFKRSFLQRLKDIKQSYLALEEDLEQLNWIEEGWNGGVLRINYSPIGVNTEEDYENFKKSLA